jgi:hypothetical protein
MYTRHTGGGVGHCTDFIPDSNAEGDVLMEEDSGWEHLPDSNEADDNCDDMGMEDLESDEEGSDEDEDEDADLGPDDGESDGEDDGSSW